ncbi:HlyD family secretion protein [Undibacterium umbellatum]|uniref:HlyD family efflux transporter periplasmic adaptor subunit n=1 Tax=Undibacterium umbellatum TaxID=2762300 RepID=A0ABR6ZAU0_9BURK|nr:HlyD family efflux transporter periplasmic adaptor subunit [Undibacterium umbellatum]MBC3908798.1 HlyD family efflux transporter periplasmic adaptor subunit [Undibacterium umbellatum]
MSNASPLFRPEVTAALGSQWMGAIRLAQPLSASLIAIVALVIAAVLIAYITFGSITKKARVTGITVPVGGQISVAAPNAGILLTSHVTEGEQVKAGQILFTLSTERQNSQGEITALVAQQLASRADSMAAEQRLRQSQYQEKKQALQQRLANLALEHTQLEQELLLAQRRQQLAQQSLAKYETLQGNGYVSAAQTQQKQEDLLDISTRLSTLQRSKTQLQANQIALQSELDTLANSLATDLTQIARAKASLKQEAAENANRQAVQIMAMQAGTVSALTNQPGQAINAGQVLASLIPVDIKGANVEANSLEAHLYVPSRTAGFIQPGQEVLIRYAAFPYQKFGLQTATVTDVSRTPFAPAELPAHLASTILSNAQQAINGFNTNEALYRIKVRLHEQSINAYGQAQMLKPGMTLEADVIQDKRRIWEWVLEPVLAMKQRA